MVACERGYLDRREALPPVSPRAVADELVWYPDGFVAVSLLEAARGPRIIKWGDRAARRVFPVEV